MRRKVREPSEEGAAVTAASAAVVVVTGAWMGSAKKVVQKGLGLLIYIT
jgi:hypothetical protein